MQHHNNVLRNSAKVSKVLLIAQLLLNDNNNQLLKCIPEQGFISLSQLSQHLQLPPHRVRNQLKQFQQVGLVFRDKKDASLFGKNQYLYLKIMARINRLATI